jgi:serpin B
MHDPLYKTFRQAFPPFCLMEVRQARQRDVTRSMRWRRSGMNRLALLVSLAIVVGCNAAASAPPSAPSLLPSRAPAVPSGSAFRPTDTPPTTPAPTAGIGMIREVRADGNRVSAGDTGGSAAQDVAEADRAFALRLYHELATGSRNLIYSPYSVSTALSMTYGGADGTTAEQLASVLGVGSDPAAWHAGRNDIGTSLDQPPTDDQGSSTPLTIKPANALFGQDGLAFKPDYLELLAGDYGAGLQAINFAADPEAARAAINRWVAVRTENHIRQLLGPATIDPATRFVLVNAIYFKASWAQPFRKGATKTAAFHRLDGSSVRVPTMHGSIASEYSHGDGWQAIDLNYVNATMTVILPDAGKFSAVERRLDAAFLAKIAAERRYTEIHLSVPRWSSTTALDLVGNLKALGVHDLFDPNLADLRGIADAGLSVGAVIHQATIKVDEGGTEAAAATAVIGDTTGGGPEDEVTIAVDRPFIFLIRDNNTGEILFAGRVLDPGNH